MSTCKLGSHFSQIGYQVGIFSFASTGHAEVGFGRLWHSSKQGGQSEQENLDSLEGVIEEFRPDIVINQMPYEREIGSLLKRKKNYLLLGCLRNTLYSVRGNLRSYVRRTAPGFLKYFAAQRLLQLLFLLLHRRRHRRDLIWILDTYDYFVMFGPPNLDELEYFVPGYDRDRVRLIPNSIPAVMQTMPTKDRRILWLGRVAHEQKQAALVLDIWRRISEMLPDWSLDIVGDGPALEELKERASSERLQRVEFHGRQAPDEYYRRSSIFFMTSAFEGFPNTLVEAMSFGAVPVVFDSYPVASWIVSNGKTGVLVRPFDIDEMAQRIFELAESAHLETMAESALNGVRMFQIDQVGQRWQGLFDEEMSKQNSVPEREKV